MSRARRWAIQLVLLAQPFSVHAAPGQLPPDLARLDSGRFSVQGFPRDERLLRALLTVALQRDTFPGLPRPRATVTILVAPDADRFRAWIGAGVPEWGAAVAMPAAQRIVMQGSAASSAAGDPTVVLRHELAHLALHEALGGIAPRWFDEGYASFVAGEWGRDEVLATNLALVLRGLPPLEDLDALFGGGESRAQQAYALAHRAVAELAALDPDRGLAMFFEHWRRSRSFGQAVRLAYGITEYDFEQRWKTATRRRYGGLALFADVTLAGILVVLVVGPLWAIRRQRDRRRLADLIAADAAQERRDRESALAAMLDSGAGESDRGHTAGTGQGDAGPGDDGRIK